MLTTQSDAFLDAIRKNDNQTILELLEAQPSLAAARDKNGVSGIFLALYRGNKEAAKEIAQRKRVLDVFEAAAMGDVNQLRTIVVQDNSAVVSHSPDGFTALALASYLGQEGSVEYLLEKGADPNAVARNATGFTALTGAASNNHTEVARLLVSNGAEVNYSYEGGFTPLIHAASAGNLELVTLLLEKGADPNAKNNEGKTPKMFAQESGHSGIVALLERHGAA